MVDSSLFLPDSCGTFLPGWHFLASSMYLLLTCLSVIISLRLKPRIPSKSLRSVPTPSESYLTLLRGGEGGRFSLCWRRCWLRQGCSVFLDGLGGIGGVGSGRSRWGERSLLSIIQAHLFLSIASFNQYCRDPKRSM